MLAGCKNKVDIDNEQVSDLLIAEVEMSIEIKAEALKELGLSDISEEAINITKKTFATMPVEVIESLDPIAMLIVNSAHGDYDFDTGVWTPTSSQIYCFDVEVFNIENMYSLFFQGIMSINDNEFEITNVVEDMSNVNQEAGQGKRNVSFSYNGQEQLFVANDNYDWFDLRIIDFMNDLFEQKGSEKKLYCFSDGYQECIVFYCTEEWAKEFEAKTGRELTASINQAE